MNRLIFSLYVEVPDNQFVDNVETNLNTKKQMNVNHQRLIDCKKEYADSIGVDFVMVNKYLDYYDEKDLANIIIRSANLMNMSIDKKSSLEIAKRSRGTPRIANRLLRRVRDYAEVKNLKKLNVDLINNSLEIEGVDTLGLDRLDRQYLNIIAKNYLGGPVGIEAISASLNEDPATLSDVVEPFLLKIGFIIRTSQGRKITKEGASHLGIKISSIDRELLL